MKPSFVGGIGEAWLCYAGVGIRSPQGDMMAESSRQKEIRKVQKKYTWFYALIVGAIALGIGIWIGSSVFAEDGKGYEMNLFTEALGVVTSIIITVFVIDRLYERRDKERAQEMAQREQERQTQELRGRLVREAGSRSNVRAIAAIEQLRHKRWLVGDKGLLKGAYLPGANLQNADLYKANLHGAVLQNARLQEILMSEGNLQEANLRFVNLQGTRLWEANLQEAKLWKANLQGAKLFKANLQDADLLGAYLQGATMRNANFNDATLPDGTKYTTDTDMERFTNPDHPDFQPTLETINEIRNDI